MKEKHYSKIKDLIPGMIVADNIYDGNNHLIIPIGTKITDKLILRLGFYDIDNVLVWDKMEVSEILPNTTYSERIKKSEDFQKFRKEFLETSEKCKESLNKIVERSASKETIDEIISSTSTLLSSQNSNLYVFDMLHNMREMDDSTYVHSINVALIATVLGRWLHMSEEELKILTSCGLLHDIGKLLIPKEILTKPKKLTEEEYTIIKTHPQKGFELLKTLDLDERILLSTLAHHERCDGSGYPLKLHSAQINDFAKIISIADVYDAMTAARVYRAPVCPFKVISIFETEGYSLYDPKYLLPFLSHVVDSYIHTSVLLSNGDTGEVIMINQRYLSRPVVKCSNSYIDLSKEKKVHIESIL